MIQFFKKIRKKLLVEDRFKKYVLYAIGEIFLVMVGILLAFQVNIWRDSSLEKKKEIKTIKLLINDLDNEQKSLRTFRSKLDEHEKNLVKLNTFINASKKDSIIKYIPRAVTVWNYRPATPTYDGLVRNNNLNIIKNDSIRNHLVIFFEEMYPYLDDLRENYKIAYKNLDEALEPHYFSEYSKNTKQWDSVFLKNEEALRKDISLKNASANIRKNLDG
jgi:hypothetical protein